MKKLFALPLALLLMAAIAGAETHVPAGPVSGVWNAFFSPYLIEGNINIPAGDTLTMMPGTQVTYQGNYALDVYGTLRVNGQPGGITETVHIQGVGTYVWNGVPVNFYSTTTQSHLQYGILSHVCLKMGPAPTTIDQCTISPTLYGLSSSGNVVTNSSLYSIHQGMNWTVTGNTINCSVTSNSGTFPVNAYGISEAQGTFTNNIVTAHAYNSNPDGYANAYGLFNCQGIIEHNTIDATTTAYGGESSAGISGGSGICLYNCVTAEGTGIAGFNGEVRNCTVITSGTGIAYVSSPVKNCIVAYCGTGYSGSFEVQYSDVFDCPTPFANGATQGLGTIQSNPLLNNGWFLTPGSPCINTGDPSSPLDPDGTRADMGAHYFAQGTAALDVEITPVNPPIVIPANGGLFSLNAVVARWQAPQNPFYVWSRDRLPDGSYTDPLLGPVQINPPVGQSVTRLRLQNVPSTWPAGTHWYIGYANPTVAYPAVDADSFPWTKSADADGGPLMWDSNCTGELFPGEEKASSQPSVFDLAGAYPNPFNPVTTIRYQLPLSTPVHLTVQDVQGRLVGILVDGQQEAGLHSVIFDGSTLASGLYFMRMQTGNYRSVQKLVLLK